MSVHKYELILLRRDPPKLTLQVLAAGAQAVHRESFFFFHPTILCVACILICGTLRRIWPHRAYRMGRFTLLFEPSAVPRLRMIRRLRETLGINLAGIAVIQDLVDRICAVHSENDALRRNHSESDL